MSTKNMVVYLGGEEYKAKKVGFGDCLDLAKKAVIHEFMNDTKESIELHGLSGKDKVDFIDRRLQKKPRGEKLSELAIEWTGIPEGVTTILYTGLKSNRGLTKKKVNALLEEATAEELTEALSIIQGGLVVPSKKPKGKTSTS